MDPEHAISYKLLRRGTAVVTSDGREIGHVENVLDNAREQIFDGIVISTSTGLRFVDAPEVGRITNAVVTLTIDAAQADRLPPPSSGAGEYQVNPSAGRLSRLFGGAWRRRR